jgi:hypothetical protein
MDCRNTWLATWGDRIDHKFVFGIGYNPEFDDEIAFDVDDSYQGLPAKIQISHKWALDHGYDYILKTDCDMYVRIPNLLKSGFENYPYSGNFYWSEAVPPFALGGSYWLDKNATECLINSPLPAYPASGGDDMWVGRVMYENHFLHHHDSRYVTEAVTKDFISLHTTGRVKYNMAEVHAACA